MRQLLAKLKGTADGHDSGAVPIANSDHKFKSGASYDLGRHVSFAVEESSVQIVTAMHLGHKVKIIDFTKAPLPVDRSSEERRNNTLAATIDAYLREHGGYRPHVSITLTGRETAFRTFLMPDLKKRELRSAVTYEVRNQIPFPPDNCTYDFRRTEIIGSKENRRTKVALYAATQSKIFDQLKPFSLSEVTVSHIYHSQEVLGLLLQSLPGFDHRETYVLLSVNRGFSEISFFEGSDLKFFHAGELGNVFSSGSTLDSSGLEFLAQSLVNEVRTSFDFFSGQFTGNITPRVYVYGDLSYSDELLEQMREDTPYDFVRFPVTELECLNQIEIEEAATVATCLPALAAAVCQRKTTNLLPRELVERVASVRNNRIGQLVLTTVMVLLFAISFALYDRVENVSAGADRLEQQVNEFKESEAFHTYNNLKLKISDHQSYIAQSQPSATMVWLGFKELSQITPSEIKLLDFSYRPNEAGRNVNVQGVVLSRDVPPELILAEYAQDLSSSPLWQDVKIVRHTKKISDSGPEIQFVIDMRGNS
ncbi:MAG: pilus assembly protein PilM [bacterium]|nr:pilus assembly protein PilM [bacterium]